MPRSGYPGESMMVKATAYRDVQKRSICWEADCPECGYVNAAHIPDLWFIGGGVHGVGAYCCDECGGWYCIEFDPSYAKTIREVGMRQNASKAIS